MSPGKGTPSAKCTTAAVTCEKSSWHYSVVGNTLKKKIGIRNNALKKKKDNDPMCLKETLECFMTFQHLSVQESYSSHFFGIRLVPSGIARESGLQRENLSC